MNVITLFVWDDGFWQWVIDSCSHQLTVMHLQKWAEIFWLSQTFCLSIYNVLLYELNSKTAYNSVQNAIRRAFSALLLIISAFYLSSRSLSNPTDKMLLIQHLYALQRVEACKCHFFWFDLCKKKKKKIRKLNRIYQSQQYKWYKRMFSQLRKLSI